MERKKKNVYGYYTIWLCLSYGYFVIPMIIFFLGWVRWIFAVPITVLLSFCQGRLVKGVILAVKKGNLYFPVPSTQTRKKMLLIGIVIVMWVLFSGVGGFSDQTTDHKFRNGMYEALVREKWPLKGIVTWDMAEHYGKTEIFTSTLEKAAGDETTEDKKTEDKQEEGSVTGPEQTMLRGYSYYGGFWMVPALCAKIVSRMTDIEMGIRSGYYFQVLWATVGILLFYAGICFYRKKLELWPLIIFIFFSGLDRIGWILVHHKYSDPMLLQHLEWWNRTFQYSSFTTQLFWVFNQCIPAWLMILLLLLEKKNIRMGLLLASSLFQCTFPAIGVLPVALYLCFFRNVRYSEIPVFQRSLEWIRKTISVENITGILLVPVMVSFLQRTDSSESVHHPLFAGGGWMVLFLFLALEIGVYWYFTWEDHKHLTLYHVVMGTLVILPAISFGEESNFCMRASIPCLVLLYLFVMETLEGYWRRKKIRCFALLCAVLLVGAVTPQHEFNRTIKETFDDSRFFEPTRLEGVPVNRVLLSENEAVDTQRSLFYRYFSK